MESLAAPATDPAVDPGGWEFAPASFTLQAGNDDEYTAALTAPATLGGGDHQVVVARFRIAGGGWTYCDQDGAGSNPDQTWDFEQSAVVTMP